MKAAIAEIGTQADLIVVSAHMGLYAEFDEENGSDSAQKILDDNPEIDVLQVAHNHVVVNEKQGNLVIGGVRNGGRDIARFDLTLDADNNIVDSAVEIVEMCIRDRCWWSSSPACRRWSAGARSPCSWSPASSPWSPAWASRCV